MSAKKYVFETKDSRAEGDVKSGMISGLASTGLYEMRRNLLDKDGRLSVRNKGCHSKGVMIR